MRNEKFLIIRTEKYDEAAGKFILSLKMVITVRADVCSA